METSKLLAATLMVAFVMLVGSHVWAQTSTQQGDVLFVCQHGNVKSLMAASYFNRLAAERGLPYRASARGAAVEAPEVPTGIATKLKAEGFDVSAFRATPVSKADVTRAQRVILIETSLPDVSNEASAKVERWDDVPAASVDYPAASQVLQAHIEQLLDQLARRQQTGAQ